MTVEKADAADNASSGGSRRRTLEIVTNWITALAAVAALVLSLVTYSQLNSVPLLRTDLARVLQIASVADAPTEVTSIWLQPLLTVTNESEATVLVETFVLTARPVTASMAPLAVYYFNEFAALDAEDPNLQPGARFGGYPTAFPVSRESPQAALLRFESTGAPRISSGTWSVELTVVLADRPAVVNQFCIDIDDEVVEDLPHFTLHLRDDVPAVSLTGCYTSA